MFWLALKQAQYRLLRGVGLGQHRSGRLAQNLGLRQLGRLDRKVSVLDTALRCLGVHHDTRQVRDGVVERLTDAAVEAAAIIKLRRDKLMREPSDCRSGELLGTPPETAREARCV